MEFAEWLRAHQAKWRSGDWSDDLANLAALQHEALEGSESLDIRHGDCHRPTITSPCLCGAEAFRAATAGAFQAAKDFQEKYG